MQKELIVKFNENEYDIFVSLCEQEKKEMSSYASEIINDFLEKNVLNKITFSVKWIDNYKQVKDMCSWITNEMIYDPRTFFILQRTYDRIINDVFYQNKNEKFKTRFNSIMSLENKKKFSSRMAILFYDTKLDFEISEAEKILEKKESIQ
jgi:hypothetical protein